MSLLKIAHVPPAKIEAGQSVLEAVRIMAREGVGAVSVIERGERAELCGVFTERDVMLRVVLQKLDPEHTKVRDVMTAPVATILEELSAEEAFNQMVDRHMRHLAIVSEDGDLLGMLSIRNLLEHLVEDLRRELNSLDQYISNDGPGG
ncbi:MAG: CBS domain-containing protein [Acidobacteria bacterium]|nr:MAG: CBS domain-containing protein [Acidobacteriota bacterium]